MKERPILFNSEMVRAILEGRKTQTRRAVKGNPVSVLQFIGRDNEKTGEYGLSFEHERVIEKHIKCPYGIPGDKLWVRETMAEDCIGSQSHTRYLADNHWRAIDWQYSKSVCPSIHMPRWASRILLEITDIRVERIQDMKNGDAVKEGIDRDDSWPINRFRNLWNSTNESKGFGWDVNPFTWVVEFKVVK